MTRPGHDGADRAAAEERGDAPPTPDEEAPNDQDSGPGAGLDGGGRYGDDG
ncbi:hypothetical protein [Lentzea sp. NPDC060358]|uniref:hypothetical protein n=1 Tax=Lentzea sp. NPDC060358 TaxID=3347103 RepID=UPI003652905A